MACESSNVETVKLLIRYGCSPLDQDSVGNNALHYAFRNSDKQVLEFLEKYCTYEQNFTSIAKFNEFMEKLKNEVNPQVAEDDNQQLKLEIFPKLLERFEPIQAKERIQQYLESVSGKEIKMDRVFKLLFDLDMLELEDVGEITDFTNLATAFIMLVYLKEVYGKTLDGYQNGKELVIAHGIACTMSILKKETQKIIDLIKTKFKTGLQTKCNFDISVRRYIELFVSIDNCIISKKNAITQILFMDVLLTKNVIISLPKKKIENYSRCGELSIPGGFGKVYKCFDGTQFVAVKLINDKRLENEEKQLGYIRELSLQSIKHPNIISLLDYGKTSDPEHPSKKSPFIVTPFANGGSLFDILERWLENIPLNLTIDWMIQISYGLSHLHTINKIHRDIKPGNIVIVYGDYSSYKSMIESELLHGIIPNSHLKIIDFGLAREDQPGENTSRRGSPNYRAPEVVNSHNYSMPADVYSLGVTFIEMIVGLILTEKEVLLSLENKVKNISEDLYTMIKEMLQIDPSERPTVIGVLDYLEALKRGTKPTLKKPPKTQFELDYII